MKKNRAAKIILIVSFAPELYCIVSGIISAVDGFDFMFNTSYGITAFINAALFTAFGLFMVGIFPAFIIIRIACIFKIGDVAQNISNKKYFAVTGVVAATVFGIILYIHYEPDIRRNAVRKREQNAAELMYSNAEEKIEINDELVSEGIYIKECVYDSLLIDYDDMKLGFLIESYLPEYSETELSEADAEALSDIKENYFAQAVIPLSSPGKRLITFYCEKDISNKTCAVILETENGVFAAADIRNRNNSHVYSKLDDSAFFVGEDVKYPELEPV